MPRISRRTFLWLTGGSSIALATNPPRKLVNRLIPLVVPPENLPSGEWSFFATTCRECPAGCGMHLWHRDGRVTKAEGNPDHPVNRGGLCPRGQSALQGLYDPDRVTGVLTRQRGGKASASSWLAALEAIGGKLRSGGRAAVVSSLQTGTLRDVMQRFAAAFPPERVLFFEPFNYEALRTAHREIFGTPAIPDYRLDRCDFVISFAADFLESWLSPVSFAWRHADTHAWRDGATLGRTAYVGPRLSMTAANADVFLQVPPGEECTVAVAVLKAIIDGGLAKRDVSAFGPAIDRMAAVSGPIAGVTPETVAQLARWFSEGKSVALAGPTSTFAPYAVQTALACALLNFAAGRIGDTVDFSRRHPLGGAASAGDLRKLLSSLDSRDVLFLHDTNILYTVPDVAPLMERAGTVVYLGTMPDETSLAADWVLPIDSPLESLGDYEPLAGINSLMQPTMGRLFDTRLAGDIFLEVARAAGKPLTYPGVAADAGFEGWLAARWEDLRRRSAPGTGWDDFWKGSLRAGGVWQEPQQAPAVTPNPSAAALLTLGRTQPLEPGLVELWPWAAITLFDGRLSNRGWIQEAPDPVTSITWGNWIDLHPRTAAALRLAQGDVAELSNAAGAIQAPVRITRDVCAEVAAISFGQGHTAMGRNAAGVGANPFLLLAAAPHDSLLFCRVRRVGEKALYDPTYTSPTRMQHRRKIVEWIPLAELGQKRAGEGEEIDWPLPQGYRRERDLYPKREYLSYRWGMAVDLQRCIGCGACAVACYAENNVPVMGKIEVARQLEMGWLRVVPYRKEGAAMRLGWLPLLCQHCDSAPCEPVCPVYASVHNEEGLNAQIYNRCIGTRYCNNNCPYKVRRFNWFDAKWEKPLDLQLNPEVTVRSRGVMEKCTFCVQRIRNAEHRATREGRKVRDGEIQPACAQSCPTRVYTFGDLLDPGTKVSRLVGEDPRRYQVLRELNTKPAVIYLRRVENDLKL